MDSFRAPLMVLGSVLIVAGSVLLLYVAILVYQVIQVPTDVPIAQFVLERIKMGDLAISGVFHDPQDATRDIRFEMMWSESVRTLSFVLIGVIIFGVLARIFSILISSGTALVKLGMAGAKPRTKSEDAL
jgi:hypothetical protein